MQRFKLIRNLIVGAVSLISVTSVSAHAASTQTIVVTDSLVDPGTEINDFYFNNNEGQGTAWVEVVTYSTSFPDNPTNVEQLTLEGLTYDRNEKKVILGLDDQTVDCADLQPPTWYRWASALVPTGACNLSARIDTKDSSSGYDTILHVEMNVTIN